MTEENKILKLNEIIRCRIPPILWELMGYILSLYAFFYDDLSLAYSMIALTGMYFLCNYIFDSLTMMIDLNDKKLGITFETLEPKNLKIKHYFLWTDKKFTSIKNYTETCPQDESFNSTRIAKNQNKNINYSNNSKYIINQKLKFEVYTNINDNSYLEFFLCLFYILGFTKKIFISQKMLNDKMNQYIEFV